MKRVICLILCAAFLFTLPFTAYAAENDDGVLITVVIPNTPQPIPTPTPAAPVNMIFPVSVHENREGNRREIIRVYELWEHESAAQIPRDAFEREGFHFELAEITRQTIPGFSTKEHMEIVTVNTQTNDLATVIQLLSPTLEFATEDGYFGILTLDITTIQMEQAGTRTSSSTVTTTREFPHLSSPDTSLVPRSVTDRNRTYELTNVEWRQQGGTNIDYRDIPTSFTAVATYSRTATSTVVTGFTTSAEYRGTVSRISSEVTRYTAYFLGVPIISPIVTPPSGGVDTSDANAGEDVYVPDEENGNGEAIIPSPDYANGVDSDYLKGENGNGEYEADSDTADDDESEDEPVAAEQQNTGLIVVIIILALAVVGLLCFINKARILGFLSKIKGSKTAAMLIVALLVTQLAVSTVYAAPPPYRFGGGERAVHIDETRHSGNSRDRPGGLVTATPVSYQYGDFLGTLRVERFNRNVRVYAGATMEAMDYGGGHFSFTGLNTGNTGIIGHNRGRAGFFSFVRLLHEGDIITLETDGITRTYAVTLQYTIDENDFSPLMAFGDNRLTLLTCVEYQPGLRRVAVATEI